MFAAHMSPVEVSRTPRQSFARLVGARRALSTAITRTEDAIQLTSGSGEANGRRALWAEGA